MLDPLAHFNKRLAHIAAKRTHGNLCGSNKSGALSAKWCRAHPTNERRTNIRMVVTGVFELSHDKVFASFLFVHRWLFIKLFRLHLNRGWEFCNRFRNHGRWRRSRWNIFALKSGAQHGSFSSLDPTQLAFANFVGGLNTAFDNPLPERVEIGFEDSFDRTDAPLFSLSTH